MSGKRSWKEALKSSSRQPPLESAAIEASSARAAATAVRVDGELAAADVNRVEEEAVAGQALVEAAGALGECGEEGVSRGEPGAGADGGDVVQVVPGALELEQDRPGAGELGAWPQPERVLAGVCVGDRLRDGAGGAGALRVGESLVERVSLGGALEAAVFVEESRVEVQDAVADDVEAEVS